MKSILKNEYDCCPCWCSPCDPDGHKGTCESNEGGECRYPGNKEKWEKCSHFATGCRQCCNYSCEMHKDYTRFKNCNVDNCKNEVVFIISDTPWCEKHYRKQQKIMEDMKVQKHDALLTSVTKNIWDIVTHEQIKSWVLIEKLMEKETKKNMGIEIDELRNQWRKIK